MTKIIDYYVDYNALYIFKEKPDEQIRVHQYNDTTKKTKFFLTAIEDINREYTQEENNGRTLSDALSSLITQPFTTPLDILNVNEENHTKKIEIRFINLYNKI